MKNITKIFGKNIVNDKINLNIKKGEIHAILGENGAGKSTLMNILSGFLKPDFGEIYIKGKLIKKLNPLIAKKIGIGMIYQHFMLIENFTVFENIILGNEIINKIGYIKKKKSLKIIKKIAKNYNININFNLLVNNISINMQQKVEILKILYRKADILILDEPTAVLSLNEIKEFFKILKVFKNENKSIILITHKLNEIKNIADRCSILKKGKIVDIVNVKNISVIELANKMIDTIKKYNFNKKNIQLNKKILSIKNLTFKNYNNNIILNNINLDINFGEIIGFAGIDGNGQNELIDIIVGFKKKYKGSILFKNKSIINKSIREIIEMGLCYIPEDRQKFGLILDMSIYNNLILKSYYKIPYSNKFGIIKNEKIIKFSNRLIDEYKISINDINNSVRCLSGGNQQKIIISREISKNPDLLLVSQPTRGLDINSINYIHYKLLQHKFSGKTILLFSFELDEILKLSDKIVVMYNGNIVDVLDSKKTNEKEIGFLMAGGKNK